LRKHHDYELHDGARSRRRGDRQRDERRREECRNFQLRLYWNGSRHSRQISARACGVVEDIRVTNIIMEDVLCPLTMNLYYACGAWETRRLRTSGFIRHRGHAALSPHPLSHITARRAKYAAAFLYGCLRLPVEDVS